MPYSHSLSAVGDADDEQLLSADDDDAAAVDMMMGMIAFRWQSWSSQ